MALHEVIIHENKTPSADKAPFTGTYISKDTIAFKKGCEVIAKLSGATDVEIFSILKGSFEEFAEMEKEAPKRIHFDGGCIAVALKGHFATADEKFNPDVHSLQLVIYLDEEVRLALANIVPTIVNDDTTTKVRLDNVVDVAEMKPYQVLHGQSPFKCSGINLVMDDEGAKIMLVDGKDIQYSCTVVEQVSKQVVIAKTDELLEAGDYKVVIQSRGGDAEGPLQSVTKKVKYLHIEPPTPTEPTLTKVVDAAHEDSPETTWDANAEEGFMFGSGLMTVRELGILKYSEEYPEGEEFTGMIDGSRTDSKLKFELAEPIGSGWTKLVFYAQDLAGHRSEVTLQA